MNKTQFDDGSSKRMALWHACQGFTAYKDRRPSQFMKRLIDSDIEAVKIFFSGLEAMLKESSQSLKCHRKFQPISLTILNVSVTVLIVAFIGYHFFLGDAAFSYLGYVSIAFIVLSLIGVNITSGRIAHGDKLLSRKVLSKIQFSESVDYLLTIQKLFDVVEALQTELEEFSPREVHDIRVVADGSSEDDSGEDADTDSHPDGAVQGRDVKSHHVTRLSSKSRGHKVSIKYTVEAKSGRRKKKAPQRRTEQK